MNFWHYFKGAAWILQNIFLLLDENLTAKSFESIRGLILDAVREFNKNPRRIILDTAGRKCEVKGKPFSSLFGAELYGRALEHIIRMRFSGTQNEIPLGQTPASEIIGQIKSSDAFRSFFRGPSGRGH